jgi:hypothetical membrane protein
MRTRIGIIIITVIILSGPLYTEAGYDWRSNIISELGAQNTRNNWLMICGFLVLGMGMIYDFLKTKSAASLPFAIFGLCLALAGLFPHKPFDFSKDYNQFFHTMHSVWATMAGISITAGLMWQSIKKEEMKQRALAFTLGVLCVLIPLVMLNLPQWDGLLQRIMYGLIFLWLWFHYPTAA